MLNIFEREEWSDDVWSSVILSDDCFVAKTLLQTIQLSDDSHIRYQAAMCLIHVTNSCQMLWPTLSSTGVSSDVWALFMPIVKMVIDVLQSSAREQPSTSATDSTVSEVSVWLYLCFQMLCCRAPIVADCLQDIIVDQPSLPVGDSDETLAIDKRVVAGVHDLVSISNNVQLDYFEDTIKIIAALNYHVSEHEIDSTTAVHLPYSPHPHIVHN
jgi:hypothetical protein